MFNFQSTIYSQCWKFVLIKFFKKKFLLRVFFLVLCCRLFKVCPCKTIPWPPCKFRPTQQITENSTCTDRENWNKDSGQLDYSLIEQAYRFGKEVLRCYENKNGGIAIETDIAKYIDNHDLVDMYSSLGDPLINFLQYCSKKIYNLTPNIISQHVT